MTAIIPIVNEFTFNNNSCGECCVAWLTQFIGPYKTPQSEPIQGVTNAQQLIKLLGRGTSTVSKTFAEGDIILCSCTPSGHIVAKNVLGSVPHWTVCKAQSNGYITIENPAGGVEQSIMTTTMNLSFRGTTIRTGIQTTTPFEQPVEGEDVLSLSTKCALVRLSYMSGLGRDPESMATEQNWAKQIDDAGTNTDAIVNQIVDSQEGKDYRAKLAKLGA